MYRLILLFLPFLFACQKNTDTPPPVNSSIVTSSDISDYLNIDLNNPYNYSGQQAPLHYPPNLVENTPGDNPITDKGATLGRVLFFDKSLSINDGIACEGCHQHQLGFTDANRFSRGFLFSLMTTAHSMRLANAKYSAAEFFWDKRAATLEQQTTQPIQSSLEMGFDAAHGGMDSLIRKMQTIPYYPDLFEWVFGDPAINEDRIQKAIAQYIRSIVSYNSKYDQGFAQVFNPMQPGGNQNAPFPNFTASENRGKTLFLDPPNQGGAGCAGCHRPPTFSLDPNSGSNGLDAGETTVFKAPSLKNVGVAGPYFHDGRFGSLELVVEHYNSGIQDGPALDNRLRPNGMPQRLNLTAQQKADLVAFMRTLDDPTLNNDARFRTPFK